LLHPQKTRVRNDAPVKTTGIPEEPLFFVGWVRLVDDKKKHKSKINTTLSPLEVSVKS